MSKTTRRQNKVAGSIMDQTKLENAVLEFVGQSDYTPVKPRKLLLLLGLEQDEARTMRKLVKRLVKAGKLAYGPNHVVELPSAANVDRISGTFRRTTSGAGFVSRISPASSGGKMPVSNAIDIHISKRHCGDASTGDIVLVRLRKKSHGSIRPNPEGEIVEVLERDTHRFVGTYFETSGYGRVQVDGKPFSRSISVGDSGAANVRINDKVVVEMVRFPSHAHDGEAVIIEVLGQRGSPGVDTLSICREFDLPGDFPENVLENAREQADNFDEKNLNDRTDLTQETVITIDPVDARDFDDAISLRKDERGHWHLGVHIADVAHFVPTGSALDREARLRSTSVYLPDCVIPMLPEIISNNLASLQPHRTRFATTAIIEFSPEGIPLATDYCRSAIQSDHRFCYEEVDEYLADPKPWEKKLEPPVFKLLGEMHTLAMILRKRRFTRGSLELSMREVKIDLDDQGRVSGAHTVKNTESHQIIEEFMLAANEAVARVFAEKEILFLRRVHPSPNPKKLHALTEFVTELGFKTESLESRFALQKLLDTVRDTPQEHAVNFAVLRSLQRAVYSPADEGHYALASDCYCHFTSPIRRYPDLTIHRLIEGILVDRAPTADMNELVALGEQCSELERRAESAERELKKVKLLNYLSTRIGEEMNAVVTGVESFGLFVQGTDLPAEGLIHISSLQDDYYHYDKASHSLTGRRANNAFQLGDFLRVTVARVDVDRRELDYRMVGRIDRPIESESFDAGIVPGQTKETPPGSEPKRSRSKSHRSATRRAANKKTGTKGKKAQKKEAPKTTPKTSGGKPAPQKAKKKKPVPKKTAKQKLIKKKRTDKKWAKKKQEEKAAWKATQAESGDKSKSKPKAKPKADPIGKPKGKPKPKGRPKGKPKGDPKKGPAGRNKRRR